MKQTLQLLLFSALILLLFSCTETEKQNANRAINVFFLGLFQVLNIGIFGISSFVLCLLGMTNKKKTLKIIGGALLGMFVLFALLGLTAVLEQHPRTNTVYILFILEFLIVGTNIVFLTLKSKEPVSTIEHSENIPQKGFDDQNDLLDF